MISIIIPVFREPRILSTIEHLLSLPHSSLVEIIIVDGDGGSTLKLLPSSLPINGLISPPGRAMQMNAGAMRACYGILLFLHADCRLPRTAVASIVQATQQFQAGAFHLSISSRNVCIRAIGRVASLRTWITRIPFGDQAQFFTAAAFHTLGGFPVVPLMEDVLIMKRLRRNGVPITLLRPSVQTSDRRWRTEGIIRCTLRNWCLQLLCAGNVNLEILAPWYRIQNM